MKIRMNLRAAPCTFLLPVAAILSSPGCSLPTPQPDPSRFYVLSTNAVRAAPTESAPVIQLRDIELANYLRTRPVIVRRGENEIEFREFALWGEPLDSGIARVLREELLARGAAKGVLTTSGRRDAATADFALTLRVLACEGAANGEVVFRAVWDLAATKGEGGSTARGDYRPTDLRWDAKTEASLAAQLSQAIAGLAEEIAAALKK